MDSIIAAEDFLQFIGDKSSLQLLQIRLGSFKIELAKWPPEHKRLSRYTTLDLQTIKDIPVQVAAEETAHLYLWVPNALLPEGLAVMEAWGFSYKSNVIWYKIRKDGGPDGRGVGFYFRNVTEILLFGVRGKGARTLQQGRSQPNIIATRKREHSRKPDEQYDLYEGCSWGPRLELFSRGNRPGWTCWGNQADEYNIAWQTYKNHSQSEKQNIKQLTLMESKVINIKSISKKKAK